MVAEASAAAAPPPGDESAGNTKADLIFAIWDDATPRLAANAPPELQRELDDQRAADSLTGSDAAARFAIWSAKVIARRPPPLPAGASDSLGGREKRWQREERKGQGAARSAGGVGERPRSVGHATAGPSQRQRAGHCSEGEVRSGGESRDLCRETASRDGRASPAASEDDFADPLPSSRKRQRPRGADAASDLPGAALGADVGEGFATRRALIESRAHGILGGQIAGSETVGATSILLSDSAGGVQDRGHAFTYVASGGESHASLRGANGWLLIAYERRSAVRVVRSAKLASGYAPPRGYRYDGLYHVTRMERLTGMGGRSDLTFTLERQPGQPPLPPPVAARPTLAPMGSASSPAERDRRPEVWASPLARAAREASREASREADREASRGAARGGAPLGGASTTGSSSRDAGPLRRRRAATQTARRAARGFPRAGVVGSPSALRLKAGRPSVGFQRQGRKWGYHDGAAPTPPLLNLSVALSRLAPPKPGVRPCAIMCHFCMRSSIGAELAELDPTLRGGHYGGYHVQCERADCRNVVCAGCLRKIFAPRVSSDALGSILRDLSSLPPGQPMGCDAEVEPREGETDAQLQLRLLREFLRCASHRWLCPACDGTCACKRGAGGAGSAGKSADGLAAGGPAAPRLAAAAKGPPTHQRHAQGGWPFPPPEHPCWAVSVPTRDGARRPPPRRLQTTLTSRLGPSRDGADGKQIGSRATGKRAGERSSADAAESLIKRGRAASDPIAKWRGIWHALRQQTLHFEAQQPQQQQQQQQRAGPLDVDAACGKTAETSAGARRRKGEPKQDAATLRNLEQNPPLLPPAPLRRGWQLATLAPPWHATAGGMSSGLGPEPVDHAVAIRAELAECLRLQRLSAPAPSAEHPEEQQQPVAQHEADYLEAREQAAREAAAEELARGLMRVQCLVDAAVRTLPADAMPALAAAVVESVRAFPGLPAAMLVVPPLQASPSAEPGPPDVGRMHLQLRWLGLGWLGIIGGRMADAGRLPIWGWMGALVDDLLPLLLQKPQECAFPAECVEAGAGVEAGAPLKPSHTVDRPLLALWLRLQQVADGLFGGASAARAKATTTPFWAVVNERLVAQGARLRVVARSAPLEDSVAQAEAGAGAVCQEAWVCVRLTQLQVVRWRRTCLAALLPLYSLDAQGLATPDGTDRAQESNWELVRVMLLDSCLNPKQGLKLGYGAGDDAVAAATELLRMCCDLSTAWTSNFNLALEAWRWSPSPVRQCSSARADHRFPPIDAWRGRVAFGPPARRVERVSASAWEPSDDCRLLGLRYLASQMFGLAAPKGGVSKLMSWADRRPLVVCCPKTHRGCSADSMRRPGCVDELWSTVASLLLAAEVQRGSPAALSKMANKMASLLPLRGSSLCASYIVTESLLQLFRWVHEGGGDVSPIAKSINTILSQLAEAAGAGAPAPGPAPAGTAADSAAPVSAPISPGEIDGAEELLLYLLEKMAALMVRVPAMPPSGSGEEELLAEPLVRLVRRAEPHLCIAALRVLEVALDGALSEPLGGGGKDGAGAASDDPWGEMDLLDDAQMLAAQKVSQFGRSLGAQLLEAWRGGAVLRERMASAWTGGGRSGGGDEGTWRRLARDVLQCWARALSLLWRDLPLEAQVRKLGEHRELMLSEGALSKFGDAKSAMSADGGRERREQRALPMHFLCLLVESQPALARAVVQHYAEDVERVWLASMVEPALSEARNGQRRLTLALRGAVSAHAVAGAPVLSALGALRPSMLSSRDSFQRIDVLTVVIDHLVARLVTDPGREARSRVEGLLHFACCHVWRCNGEMTRLSQVSARGWPAAEAEAECKAYSHFACWLACALLEKLPRVLLANDGRSYEWLVGHLVQKGLSGVGVYPALRKEARSRLRQLLVHLTRMESLEPVRIGKGLDEICRHSLPLGATAGDSAAASKEELLALLRQPSFAHLARRQLNAVVLPRLLLPRWGLGLQPSDYASRVTVALEALGDVLHKYLALPKEAESPLTLWCEVQVDTLHGLILPAALSALLDAHAIPQPAAIHLASRLFEHVTFRLLSRRVAHEAAGAPEESSAPEAAASAPVPATVLQRIAQRDADWMKLLLDILMAVYLNVVTNAMAAESSAEQRGEWAPMRSTMDEHLRVLRGQLARRFPGLPREAPPSLPLVPTRNLPVSASQPYGAFIQRLGGLATFLRQAPDAGAVDRLGGLVSRLGEILDKCRELRRPAQPSATPLQELLAEQLAPLLRFSQSRAPAPAPTLPLAAPALAAVLAPRLPPTLPPAAPALAAVPAPRVAAAPTLPHYATLPTAPPAQFSRELRQLGEMGFNNAERNLKVLLSTGGSIERSVDKLATMPR